jgi:hypothetical protein
LTPRNAIAALNELHGQSVNESVVIPTQGNKFEAEITINNIRYVGVGNSKMQAKNAASEKALRDLVINKFRQLKSVDAVVPTPAPVEGTEDVNMEEEKDDVPMLQLASFALHKLFAEWESEGFEIPLPKSNVSVGSFEVLQFSKFFFLFSRLNRSPQQQVPSLYLQLTPKPALQRLQKFVPSSLQTTPRCIQ